MWVIVVFGLWAFFSYAFFDVRQHNIKSDNESKIRDFFHSAGFTSINKLDFVIKYNKPENLTEEEKDLIAKFPGLIKVGERPSGSPLIVDEEGNNIYKNGHITGELNPSYWAWYWDFKYRANVKIKYNSSDEIMSIEASGIRQEEYKNIRHPCVRIEKSTHIVHFTYDDHYSDLKGKLVVGDLFSNDKPVLNVHYVVDNYICSECLKYIHHINWMEDDFFNKHKKILRCPHCGKDVVVYFVPRDMYYNKLLFTDMALFDENHDIVEHLFYNNELHYNYIEEGTIHLDKNGHEHFYNIHYYTKEFNNYHDFFWKSHDDESVYRINKRKSLSIHLFTPEQIENAPIKMSEDPRMIDNYYKVYQGEIPKNKYNKSTYMYGKYIETTRGSLIDEIRLYYMTKDGQYSKTAIKYKEEIEELKYRGLTPWSTYREDLKAMNIECIRLEYFAVVANLTKKIIKKKENLENES